MKLPSFDMDIYGTQKSTKKSKRRSIPVAWKKHILIKQDYKCAGKLCAKQHHGKRVRISVNNNFDHIKALGLGGKHEEKNIQGLCANCHNLKTSRDREKMATAKRNQKKSPRNELLDIW